MVNSIGRHARPKPSKQARRRPSRATIQDNPQIVSDLCAASAAFVTPASEATSRCSAIPLLRRGGPRRGQRDGRVTFDSWAKGAPIAMRDVTDGHIRCLHLAAGALTVEMVAERRQLQWEFVARVYSAKKVLHDCVLRVGNRRLLARTGGFFHWISGSVPHQISLLTFESETSFGRLSW